MVSDKQAYIIAIIAMLFTPLVILLPDSLSPKYTMVQILYLFGFNLGKLLGRARDEINPNQLFAQVCIFFLLTACYISVPYGYVSQSFSLCNAQ